MQQQYTVYAVSSTLAQEVADIDTAMDRISVFTLWTAAEQRGHELANRLNQSQHGGAADWQTEIRPLAMGVFELS